MASITPPPAPWESVFSRPMVSPVASLGVNFLEASKPTKTVVLRLAATPAADPAADPVPTAAGQLPGLESPTGSPIESPNKAAAAAAAVWVEPAPSTTHPTRQRTTATTTTTAGATTTTTATVFLVLEQRLDGLGIAGVVWDAGEAAARVLAARPALVVGATVLDLGCGGSGVCGLAAAACGARATLLTDLPEVGPLVEANLAAHAAVAPRCSFQPYKWPDTDHDGGDDEGPAVEEAVSPPDAAASSSSPPPSSPLPQSARLRVDGGGFDVILCADCMYDAEMLAPLVRALNRCAKPSSLLLLAYKRRVDARERPCFERLSRDWLFCMVPRGLFDYEDEVDEEGKHEHQPQQPQQGKDGGPGAPVPSPFPLDRSAKPEGGEGSGVGHRSSRPPPPSAPPSNRPPPHQEEVQRAQREGLQRLRPAAAAGKRLGDLHLLVAVRRHWGATTGDGDIGRDAGNGADDAESRMSRVRAVLYEPGRSYKHPI